MLQTQLLQTHVAQDNDQRDDIQKIRTDIPNQNAHRGRGQNFSIFRSCRCLVKLGPSTTGSTGCRRLAFFSEDFLKALETTTAMKLRKVSCSWRAAIVVGSDLSFHGCWLGLVGVWRLLCKCQNCCLSTMARWRSRHFTLGCYRLRRGPGGCIANLQKHRSFVAVVVSCAV